MTDFWIGSDEWPTWYDGEPAVVLRDVPSDGALGLQVRLERTGDEVLAGRFFPLPLVPGRPLGAIVTTRSSSGRAYRPGPVTRSSSSPARELRLRIGPA